jgi:tetratricopeptide (TPR) repeat protein
MHFNLRYLLLIFLTITFNSYAGNSIWKETNRLQAKGLYEQAAETMKPVLSEKDEYSLLRYAYLLHMQSDYGDAINYYAKAIKLNPKSIDAKLGITLPLMAQKRWKQVKSYSLDVLKLSHWNYTAHIRLLMAEEGMRKWSTLAKHAKQLAVTYPADATALVYLARSKAWLGDKKSAKYIYKKVLMRVPGHIEASAYLKSN